MDYISLITIAIGLSMDAFAVSISNGAVTKNLKLNHAFKIAICFGLFQAIMPIIGWVIGITGASLIEAVDHFIAFILLSYIGGKMIYDGIKDSKKEKNCDLKDPISLKMLIVMAIATSIDALATGIILPSVVQAYSFNLMLLSVSIIGIITFLISFIGVYIGKKFGDLFSSKAQLLGGSVLIKIGLIILIEHTLFS